MSSRRIPGEDLLRDVLTHYQTSFAKKSYSEENDDHDPLMDVFGITPDLKRENRQYWGRELGMCWQRLVTSLFQAVAPSNFRPGLEDGDDELCDLIAWSDAIDTKYRIGSGDAGTLKKFKAYGRSLTSSGYSPVMLIVRVDNLPAAITACKSGGWSVLEGQATFDYIFQKTNVRLDQWMQSLGSDYKVER
jgi:hypothetical protein